MAGSSTPQPCMSSPFSRLTAAQPSVLIAVTCALTSFDTLGRHSVGCGSWVTFSSSSGRPRMKYSAMRSKASCSKGSALPRGMPSSSTNARCRSGAASAP